jgi:hypothetical protein
LFGQKGIKKTCLIKTRTGFHFVIFSQLSLIDLRTQIKIGSLEDFRLFFPFDGYDMRTCKSFAFFQMLLGFNADFNALFNLLALLNAMVALNNFINTSYPGTLFCMTYQ